MNEKIIGIEVFTIVTLTATSSPCYIALTHKAKERFKILNVNPSEFFNVQESFSVHIERTDGRDDALYIQVYFDVIQNKELIKLTASQGTPSLRGVIKDKVFLITSLDVSKRSFAEKNNRRISAQLHFFQEDGMESAFPEFLFEQLQKLPIAKERSIQVKNHLESWESYLTLLEQKAENNEATLEFKAAKLKNNLKELIIYCSAIEETKGKRLSKARVKIKDSGEEIGVLKKIDYQRNLIEIKLTEDYVDLLKRNKWNPLSEGTVHISNYGDLTQVRRLKGGFRTLINGKSINPNLEHFLFEDEPNITDSKPFEELIFNNKLDEYQQQAVSGAMRANDLYLIQGPPGTGKTTVISEICYQNAKKGLKTLVASQSNLAVDNALSRLLVNPEIRILRKGRTTSIEEEGKKFIEENISDTWKNQLIDGISDDITELEKLIKSKEDEIKSIDKQLIDNTEEIKSIKKIIENNALFNAEKNKLSMARIEVELKEKEINIQIKKHKKLKKELETTMELLTAEIADLVSSLKTDQIDKTHNKEKKDLEANLKDCEERMNDLDSDFINLKKDKEYLEQSNLALKKKNEELEEVKVRFDKYIKEINDFTIKKQKVFYKTHLTLSKELNILEKNEIESSNIQETEKKLTSYEKLLAAKRNEEPKEKYLDLQPDLEKLITKLETILSEFNYRDDGAQAYFAKSFYSNLTQYTPSEIHKAVDFYYTNSFTGPSFAEKLLSKITSKKPKNFDSFLERYRIAIEMNEFIIWKVKEIEKNSEEIHSTEEKVAEALKAYQIEAENIYEKKILKLSDKVDKLDSRKKLLERETNILEGNYQDRARNFVEKDYSEVDDSRKKALQKIELVKRKIEKIEKAGKGKKELKERVKSLIVIKREDLTKVEHLLEITKEKLQKSQEDSIEIASSKMKIEHQINKVEAELDVVPPETEKELEGKNYYLRQQKETIEKKDRIDALLKIDIKKAWLNSLVNSQAHDLEEIKKLYIKHANVIGITCVQSASREFVEEYPDFDVVIIDEVSKATPPELLLPMLKGKKIILVGDHKQLPPLIGQETLEETIEKLTDSNKKETVEKILNESLFERLFGAIPSENKMTLKIQYRMHKDIMETISQFYVEDENPYGLICGIQNSDKERDHKMQGKYIHQGQHLLWFDTPGEKEFFESQEPGGTSKYNESELKIIETLIDDMEQAMMRGKLEGRIEEQETKQIGVISFYGEQVKRIEALIDEKDYSHLTFRVGTVDRFQGIEMDVIITSFVRNHNNSNEGIGFARDFRRLNVALSRARELLVIVGSAKMFTQRSKDAKKMYLNVSKTVRSKNGLRDHRGLVK